MDDFKLTINGKELEGVEPLEYKPDFKMRDLMLGAMEECKQRILLDIAKQAFGEDASAEEKAMVITKAERVYIGSIDVGRLEYSPYGIKFIPTK